jgi:hypothetical protein
MFDVLIEKILKSITPENREKLNTSATITADEHYAYQTLQSTAFAGGKINQDVATFLFTTLGGSHTVFNRQPLPVRLLAIQMIGIIAR